MALPSWPEGLPCLPGDANAFQAVTFSDGIATTSFDDGPAMARNRKLFDSSSLSCSLWLKSDEFQTFMDFVKRDLNRGAARFTAPVVGGDLQPATRVCRLIGSGITTKAFGLDWMVSFTVDVMDWQ